MRRSQRLIATAVVVALSGALAGCAGGMSSFDPSDLLDFLDTKKKLPGERKPVFPEGVPGLEQGVPKDLYKGSRAGADRSAERRGRGGRRRAACRRSRNRSAARSPRGKQPATASRAPAPAAAPDPDAAPEEEGSTAAAPPPPKPAKIVRRRTTAPPPDPPAAQPAPASRNRNNPLRHSRRRCRAAPSRADFDRFARCFILRVLHRNAASFSEYARARIAYVFHDCHHRPAQCRKIDAVQPAGRAEARAGR